MAIITGSYGSPLVLSQTPYSKVRILNPLVARNWPPYIDAERLERYDEYLALIENRVADVFESAQLAPGQKSKILLAAALPELLCNVWADSVWSDPPEIELPNGGLQDAWDRIDFANDWTEIGAWESVFAAAAFGHSIVKLRRDDTRQAQFGTDVVIEEIDPAIYFPVMKARSSREVDYVVLAWEENRAEPGADKDDLWQMRELHRVEDGQYRITYQERKSRTGWAGEPDFRTINEETPEGVDFLPFVELHAKRWRGRYWGLSEIGRNLSLFDEIDNTLSNIAEILDYHGKPMLQVPASILYGGVLNKGVDRVIGIRRPEDANVARYVTYDGQLDAAMASLDKTIELVFLTSEVPRTYFGMGDLGNTPSGTSLKLQLQNYVKKANRWQRNESSRSNRLVDMALRLDGKVMDANKPAKITHGSPLPVDDEQEARIETSLVTAGLSARRTSITKLRRVDDVDEELALIDDDKEPPPGALPQLPPGNQGGVIVPNPPEPPAA